MKRRSKGMKKWNLRSQFKDKTIRRSEDASMMSADLEGGSMGTGGSRGSIRAVRTSTGTRRH